MAAWADSQCVTHCIRRMAAPRRSTPHCCANFSLAGSARRQYVMHCIKQITALRRSTPNCGANLALHKNLYAAFAARASKVYRAEKPSLGGRGTAASAVVDEGRFLTFTASCWSFLLFFPHPSALRAATFSREKVLGCCKRQCVKHQFIFQQKPPPVGGGFHINPVQGPQDGLRTFSSSICRWRTR